ncbi:histidine phosphatase family protein [Cryobacterium sp. BB307]|uniref:histidine phosphatase family protein n=1 Tax=Cryobacterium sp. BB307 TaxID=2716317 RepID=UPI0014484BC4
MSAALIHLVRHGEVHNPEGILYGRLPGYHLSGLGLKMAQSAAESMDGRTIERVFASPLQRAQESAEPWAEKFDLEIITDERLIEPTNRFEGGRFEFGPQVLLKPKSWPWVVNPWLPSWGEPYQSVIKRMMAAIEAAWHSADGGEVVMVSHQMPIVMVQRHVAGLKPFHDPRKRRCSLSSITTLTYDGTRFVQVGYTEPAAALLAESIDQGAV